MPTRCDMHNVDKVIFTPIDTGGMRDRQVQEVECDDAAEWLIEDDEGNLFNVCTGHLGYPLHEKHKEYKVSPIGGE